MAAGGTAGNSAAFDVTFPEKVEPGSRSLSIRVSPSIAGSLFGALDYLTSFPYGCVEQTMSSFLPNIVVKDAVHTLNLKRKWPTWMKRLCRRKSAPVLTVCTASSIPTAAGDGGKLTTAIRS